jgi:hypothetical protein
MTVFEWLFKAPAALRRQRIAPLYTERLAYLTHMKERDRRHNTIHSMATHLLQINRTPIAAASQNTCSEWTA